MAYCDVPRYVRTCRHLGITLTTEQRRAFWYLESHGQRFLIDFGTANAIERAARLRAIQFADRLRESR